MGREAREVWEKRVARWRDSNLSAKEFASETGINARTLSYWAWRVERQGGGEAEVKAGRKEARDKVEPEKEPTWLEVVATPLVKTSAPITARASSAPAFELMVSTGRTVRVPADFDAEALQRLLAVLEGR
jgi:transposase-like protein